METDFVDGGRGAMKQRKQLCPISERDLKRVVGGHFQTHGSAAPGGIVLADSYFPFNPGNPPKP
jgi:hypothetical protein